MKTPLKITILIMLFLSACSPPAAPQIGTAVASTVVPVTFISGASAPPPIDAPPTPIPTLAVDALSPTELKYRLLEEFPDFFFCDPDEYPVARDDETALAIERFPEIQANAEEFQAILKYNNMAGLNEFNDEQKLLIYREHKKLAAIPFEVSGGQYKFQFQTADSSGRGTFITGLIDKNGTISIQDRTSTIATCPICLAANTQIDTPNGLVAVQDLRVGDVVWTADASGQRVAAPVLATTRVPAPASHVMIHLVLDNGRELWASPGHPTTDGRTMNDLQPDDLLDGARVILSERIPYAHPSTFDLLPAGETGFYWANGILIGSTLAKQQVTFLILARYK